MERLTLNTWRLILEFIGLPSVFNLERVNSRLQTMLRASVSQLLSMLPNFPPLFQTQVDYEQFRHKAKSLFSALKPMQIAAYFTINEYNPDTFWSLFPQGKSNLGRVFSGEDIITSGVFTGYKEEEGFRSLYPQRLKPKHYFYQGGFLPEYARDFLHNLDRIQLFPLVRKIEISVHRPQKTNPRAIMCCFTNDFIVPEQLQDWLQPFFNTVQISTIKDQAEVKGLKYEETKVLEPGLNYEMLTFKESSGDVRPVFWLGLNQGEFINVNLSNPVQARFIHILFVQITESPGYSTYGIRAFGHFYSPNNDGNRIRFSIYGSSHLPPEIKVPYFTFAVFSVSKLGKHEIRGKLSVLALEKRGKKLFNSFQSIIAKGEEISLSGIERETREAANRNL